MSNCRNTLTSLEVVLIVTRESTAEVSLGLADGRWGVLNETPMLCSHLMQAMITLVLRPVTFLHILSYAMFALAAWRGFSVLALGMCSRAGQQHYLVSVNLDVILLAAMLDGILCSVWSSYATSVGGGSETAQSWWLSWALAIAVAGRLTGTLLSTLLGRQYDSELLAYKRWELILVVCRSSWSAAHMLRKTRYRPGSGS